MLIALRRRVEAGGRRGRCAKGGRCAEGGRRLEDGRARRRRRGRSRVGRCNADDGSLEAARVARSGPRARRAGADRRCRARARRHRGSGSRRRCAGEPSRRAGALVHHQHRALELRRRALHREPALRAGLSGFRILSPTVRTEHREPPQNDGECAERTAAAYRATSVELRVIHRPDVEHGRRCHRGRSLLSSARPRTSDETNETGTCRGKAWPPNGRWPDASGPSRSTRVRRSSRYLSGSASIEADDYRGRAESPLTFEHLSP